MKKAFARVVDISRLLFRSDERVGGSGTSTARVRGFGLLVLVLALSSTAVAQFTYTINLSDVSVSFTAPALLAVNIPFNGPFTSSTLTGAFAGCNISAVVRTNTDPANDGILIKFSNCADLSDSCTPWGLFTGVGIYFNDCGDSVAIAAGGSYYVDYYSNNINPLAADQVIRAINVGIGGTPLTSPAGDICENLYVFDNNQEMIACCACRLTPNALSSATVGAQLTNHALTGTAPVAGVVKIAFTQAPAGGCQAETADLTGADATIAAVVGTHLQAEPPGSTRLFATETQKDPQGLSPAEAAFLPQACGFVRYLGSGAPGTCSCTAGVGAR